MCLFRFEIWISEYKNSKVYICITYPYISTFTLLFVDICTIISLKKHSVNGLYQHKFIDLTKILNRTLVPNLNVQVEQHKNVNKNSQANQSSAKYPHTPN